MRKLVRSIAPFVPALALMALIFAFSAVPSDGEDRGVLVLLARKLAHFGLYFLLMGLWWWALATKVGARRAIAPALTISVAYAISDELHQTFVDGRVGTWRDVALDTAGALTATWLILRSRARRRVTA